MLHDLSSRSCEGSARRSPRTLLDLQWHYSGRHADADPGTCLGTRGCDWRCLRRSADTSALRSIAAAACGDTCQADAGRAASYTGCSSARRTGTSASPDSTVGAARSHAAVFTAGKHSTVVATRRHSGRVCAAARRSASSASSNSANAVASGHGTTRSRFHAARVGAGGHSATTRSVYTAGDTGDLISAAECREPRAGCEPPADQPVSVA